MVIMPEKSICCLSGDEQKSDINEFTICMNKKCVQLALIDITVFYAPAELLKIQIIFSSYESKKKCNHHYNDQDIKCYLYLSVRMYV